VPRRKLLAISSMCVGAFCGLIEQTHVIPVYLPSRTSLCKTPAKGRAKQGQQEQIFMVGLRNGHTPRPLHESKSRHGLCSSIRESCKWCRRDTPGRVEGQVPGAAAGAAARTPVLASLNTTPHPTYGKVGKKEHDGDGAPPLGLVPYRLPLLSAIRLAWGLAPSLVPPEKECNSVNEVPSGASLNTTPFPDAPPPDVVP
jgi:hypothetical protein